MDQFSALQLCLFDLTRTFQRQCYAWNKSLFFHGMRAQLQGQKDSQEEITGSVYFVEKKHSYFRRGRDSNTPIEPPTRLVTSFSFSRRLAAMGFDGWPRLGKKNTSRLLWSYLLHFAHNGLRVVLTAVLSSATDYMHVTRNKTHSTLSRCAAYGYAATRRVFVCGESRIITELSWWQATMTPHVLTSHAEKHCVGRQCMFPAPHQRPLHHSRRAACWVSVAVLGIT